MNDFRVYPPHRKHLKTILAALEYRRELHQIGQDKIIKNTNIKHIKIAQQICPDGGLGTEIAQSRLPEPLPTRFLHKSNMFSFFRNVPGDGQLQDWSIVGHPLHE